MSSHQLMFECRLRRLVRDAGGLASEADAAGHPVAATLGEFYAQLARSLRLARAERDGDLVYTAGQSDDT